MLQETMQKIREAEFKADNILKQSEEDARDIVEDAGKKAVSMKHEAAVSYRQRMDETAKTADTWNERELQVALKEAGTEITKLRELAERKEKEAIELVLSLIW